MLDAMASIATLVSRLRSRSILPQIPMCKSTPRIFTSSNELNHGVLLYSNYLRFSRKKMEYRHVTMANRDSDVKPIINLSDTDTAVDLPKSDRRLHETVATIPLILSMRKYFGTNFGICLLIATTAFLLALRFLLTKMVKKNNLGSVDDLVKRGQLRSDRRGISKPLKYEDPFNNPMVKVGKSNSTIEMCGKVYRLAPVTLTKEQQTIHQKRRSRAYQWKRPTTFLKEGDEIPPNVDPDTIRWIPSNHPFATTVNDIDENLAQSNVYQKDGVPFRIKAEHEVLQKKLEELQSEKKLKKVTIVKSSFKMEEPEKQAIHETVEHNLGSEEIEKSKSSGPQKPSP